MGNTYEEFSARYNSQWDAVFAVAKWLHGHAGTEVTINPRQLRKKHETREDFYDFGDIKIVQEGITRIVEVKHDQKNDFTDIDEYPFKFIALANKASFERNADKVSAYIRVSKSLTHVLVMPVANKDKWVLDKKWMTNTEQHEELYLCPKEFATIHKLG
jgi:hypothetical protein